MLKITKIKTSKNWYIRGTVKGTQVFQSSGTTRRDIAEREAREIENRILEGTTITFGDAVKSYIKRGGSPKFLLDQFDKEADKFTGVIGQFEHAYMSDIGQAELDEAALIAFPNVKPQTLNRQFYTPFIAVWNDCAKTEGWEKREWRRPRVKKADKAKTKWFSYKEAARQYDALSPHLRILYLFLVYTGARPTEAIELDIKSLDLKKRWAILESTKTDNFRGVPLHRALVRELRKYIGKRKEGRVFLTNKGMPYSSKRSPSGLTKGGGYIKTGWKTGLTKSGLMGYTPYSCRHTLNNWLILEGVEQTTREAIMGHSGDSTNSIYSDVPQDHLIETIDLLKDFTDFSRL